MKIAIVTDSTSYLSKEQIEKNNITITPIPVIIDNKIYNEGVDITTEEFYEKLKTSDSFPSTSQPSVGEMINLYDRLGSEGYDVVLSIHLTNTISGFVDNLKNIAPTIESTRVIPYDSGITVMLMGYLALEAAKMAKEEADIDDIINRLDDLKTTLGEYFIVDDLQNLVRGGRLSNASAFIGSVLKIKPILTFDSVSNKIVAFEKIRSTKKAIKRVEDLFEEHRSSIDYPLRGLIIHANDEASALKWQIKMKKKYPDMTFDISYFGPVIGTHLGEKALALAWIKDFDQA
ncbi:DegV family protein [Dellaglioa carnosa]|uniref:DegV family protein n=1 Tax=Dellaglioa carnosa TaxID=2995136 RepID=A0ABT4JLJ4_9LACO|nr:DegV family protein [Dellaglioa carnosa]MCZ2490950.1 DegV family protein [Dellaglioa carnosa]MCZ2494028.1 DegV family protein [Dellaglioa carnosa]MDK1730892.1 DegV family protein [Dellaglioa carnosa]